MEIQNVIIHEIKKREQVTSAEIFLTQVELDIGNQNVKNIIESLDKSFAKKSPRRAKFSDEGFKSVISDFSNINIVLSTQELARKLKDQVGNIPAAKGGYLIFAKYRTTRTFFSVFYVRNTEGSQLEPADNRSWDISSTIYLDVVHFAMGVRINLDTLCSDSDDRYIHLVKGNTDISDYFERWVGVDEIKQESKDSQALYEVSNNIALPEGLDRTAFKKQIFDYIDGRPSRVVNLRDLSSYLFNNPDTIDDYCVTNDVDIDGEFRVTPAQLRKFTKVSVSADGITLEASRDLFNPNRISISDDNSIVTIRSPALAEKLLEDLDS